MRRVAQRCLALLLCHCFAAAIIQPETLDSVLTISPNVTELILNEGEPLKITCSFSKHLKFVYPKQENNQTNIDVSEPTEREFRDNAMFVYEFERVSTVFGDTGWYGCADFDEPDVSPEIVSPRAKWIYVYVKSAVNFFVQTVGEDQMGGMLTGVVSHEVLIPCRPTSPDFKVDFFDEGENEIDVDDKKVSFDPRFGFKIRNLAVIDSNTYICVIENNDMRQEIKYHLYVSRVVHLVPPIINEDSLQHIIEGETLRVNCSLTIESDVLFTLNWTIPFEKDNRVSMRTYQEYHYNNKKKAILELTVTNVTMKDEGVYTCFVKSRSDSTSRNVYIKIHDPKTTYIHLKPEYNDTYYKFNEGQKLTWRVYVEAHPPPDLQWYGPNGREIKSSWYDSEDMKYLIHNTSTTISLSINKLSLSDGGNYSLQASNGHLIETLNYTLDVYAKPVVYIGETHPYYIVNTNAYFLCSVAAFPSPSIKWTYQLCPNYPSLENSTVINLYEFQTLTSYTKFESTVSLIINMSGIISCTACNTVDCDTSSEPVLVTDIHDGFGIESSKNMFVEGDNLELICGASIYNYTDRIIWLDGKGREIKETDRIRLIRKTTPFTYQKILNIKNVKLTDADLFTCKSETKDRFSEELQYELEVLVAVPVVITDTNMNKTDIVVDLNDNEQESVVLRCFMDGRPFPNVTWYKNNIPIKQTEQFEFSHDNQKLRIKYLFEKDNGLYKCRGVNRLNEQSLYTKIVVKGKNVSPTWIIVVVVLILVCIGLIIYFSIKMHREKVIRKQLTEAGLMHFEDGALECLNPELTVDDQAELLPYDKRYEFPRQRLKLGKQLGSGAFGVVMKAEAQGIIDSEETTTVAVKMVRRSADPTNIRALASELKIMIHLGKHLNVVNLLGACTNNIIKRELLVIVEYCRFGNLHNYLLRHRSNFVNQIDPETGRLDVSIKSNIPRKSAEEDNYNRAKYAVLTFNNNSGHDTNSQNNVHSGNSTVDTEAALYPLNPENEQINSDGFLQSNNSVQPGWRSNYRGDYKDLNLKPICTQDLLSWAFQVARGMEYLSKRKVLHGDLAARNILLAENDVVKICDFGLAKTMYQDDNYKKKGDELLPIKWLAIESIRDRVFSTQSDVWSYGIVLWEFFTLATTPYPGMEAEKIYQKLIEGYRMEQPEYAIKEIYDIMLMCWKAKPVLRPSFTDLVENIGDLLEDNVKSYYIDLNTPYINMNTSAQEGKDDYLKMVSAPDYTLLSTPNHEYVNTATVEVSQPEPNLATRDRRSPSSRHSAGRSSKSSHSEQEEPNETEPMLNEEEDNYLKPINIHEKRAEFMRQRQAKNKADKEDQSPGSNYYNTPSNARLIDLRNEPAADSQRRTPKDRTQKMKDLSPGIIRTQDNYVNMPKQKSNLKSKSDLPDSFSNPTYIFMESNANVQSSEV